MTSNIKNFTSDQLNAMTLKQIAEAFGIPSIVKMSKEKAVAKALSAQVCDNSVISAKAVLTVVPTVAPVSARAVAVAAKRAEVQAKESAKTKPKVEKTPRGKVVHITDNTCENACAVAREMIEKMMLSGNLDRKAAVAACAAEGISYRTAVHAHYHLIRSLGFSKVNL